MRLRDHIRTVRGIRYLTEELEIISPAGRKCMLDLPMMTDPDEIERSLGQVDLLLQCLVDRDALKAVSEICLRLMQLRDVEGSVLSLYSGAALTDIDLFELKNLALITTAIDEIRERLPENLPCFPNVEEVVSTLDPERKRLPTFMIYDSYSIELSELRKRHRALSEGDEKEALWVQIAQVEDKVRRKLSHRLQPMAPALKEALDLLGFYDLLIAKGKMAMAKAYIRPRINRENRISYTDLRHPQVEEILKTKGQSFQPVSIVLQSGVALITGANMAGKSVLLRSLALAQLMTQYGFYLPAKDADVCPVRDVMLCIGDAQDETEGLSSYGAEMLRLSEICRQIAQGQTALVLVDEPARTTNPTEGQAIVSGLVELLSAYSNTVAVLTTHYSSIEAPCRRLRVRGFVEERMKTPLHVNELNSCIDYSLEEIETKNVPHEAIRIAQILGVYSELIDRSIKYIK